VLSSLFCVDAMADSLTFIIPGAPPSVNHSYRPVKVRNKTGGTSLRMAKADSVLAYQTLVAHLVRLARPPRWQLPEGYIRVRYAFYLRRDIDCDNAMKALNDAIAGALGVNDKRFLPCVTSKTVSPKEDPRVEVELSPFDSSSPPTEASTPSP
jgi:Holliday junction resolvase RusA-like endonuclease